MLQASHWRGGDGRVNPRLEQASERRPWIFRGEEKKGPESRAAVELLQEALMAAGCTISGREFGVYGDETARAVRTLQADPDNHLSSDDGITGSEVLGFLDRMLLARERGAAAPAPVVYEFLIEGRRYRTEGADLYWQFDRVINVVQNCLLGMRDVRRSHARGWEGIWAAFRGAAEALGQTHMPSERPLNNGYFECQNARAALAQRDYARAAEKIGRAIFFYELAKGLWRDYILGTDSGAERARVGLRYFRDGCFAVVATWLTGGVAAEIGAAGVVTGAAGRVLVTAGTGAVVSGATTAVRELTTYNAAAAMGVDPEVNWPELASTITDSMLAGFVSSLISGGLAPAFARLFPINCPELLFAQVNMELRAGTMYGGELSRTAFQSTLSRVAGRVLASIPNTVLIEAARTALQQPNARRSFGEFVKEFTARLPRQLLVNAIAEAVVGVDHPRQPRLPDPPFGH